MATPFYRLIPGAFIVVGKAPDGDSVRFRPDRSADLDGLERSYLIRRSKVDGTVQLRLDGIDATELHYGGASQPLAVEGRDTLLQAMGWTSVVVKPGSTTVTAATPVEVRGAILSKAAEQNGRPIAFVLAGADAEVDPDRRRGGWMLLDDELLVRTMNYVMVRTGMAYPTFYSSLADELRLPLRQAAAAARERGDGVWPIDATALFKLSKPADIDARSGQAILPKLFRRSTDYFKDVARGFRGNLPDWIVAHQAGSRTEDDLVHVTSLGGEVPLSSLLSQRNDQVSFLADPLDVVFVEK